MCSPRDDFIPVFSTVDKSDGLRIVNDERAPPPPALTRYSGREVRPGCLNPDPV